MMQKTDICEHAIEGLRKSCVKTVHIVGRRGPLQVRYAGLAHATGVHERNTVPYARFALKKGHGFCAKAREKNM